MANSHFTEKKPLIDEPSTIGKWTTSLRLTSWYSVKHDTLFCSYLIFTTTMLIFPWIFFGAIRGLGGIPIHNGVVEKNPKATSYVLTAISNIIAAIMTHLFSTAVSYLAQKRIVHKGAAISHVAFFAALKNRTFALSLFRRGRYDLFIVVFLYSTIFISITPGITTLLTPSHFTRSIQLSGHELNFASKGEFPACAEWFNGFRPGPCNWMLYKGLHYTDCPGENQFEDTLESGRGNILSLFQDNVSITYRQFAPAGGLNFLGSTRGILPNGPNGIPAFNTLNETSNSYFSGATIASQRSYNYTLDLQGISTNVTCKYVEDSPVTATVLNGGDLVQYNGSCPTDQYIPVAKSGGPVPFGDHSLGFWPCLAAPSALSYNLYFRGYQRYSSSIGNITCNISPIYPTVFSLTYTGQSNRFSVQASNSTPSSIAGNGGTMMTGIQNIVSEAQSSVSNLFAESIITLGVKSFSLPPDAQDSKYIELYEAMIRGILDYQATYIRLLYSVHADTVQPPPSCMRPVNGSVNLDMFGWSSTYQTAVFLLPVTFVNLTTLVILVIAMYIADKGPGLLPCFDPTDPESLLLSHDASGRLLLSAMTQPADHTPWSQPVAFGKNKYGVYRLWPLDQVVST